MRADQEYIDNINRLIPLAEARAVARARRKGLTFQTRAGSACSSAGNRSVYQHCFVSEFFHEEMNLLAAEEGVRPGTGRAVGLYKGPTPTKKIKHP